MKQDAFIQRLRQALGSLPKRDVDEIVADYREYIGDALSAGRTEEDVIAALGEPEKLARELKAQANFRQWEERRSFGNLMRVVGSIAGLGLLHLVLLVPFLLYMLVLTLGYVFFGALTVAGLVTLVAFGSHYVFGTPVPGVLPFGGGAAQLGAAGASGKADGKGATDGKAAQTGKIAQDPKSASAAAADALNDAKELRVEGERYVLDLHDGSRVSIVTRKGVIDSRKQGGKLSIDATGDGARELLTTGKDDTLGIARADVIALDLKSANGDQMTVANTGGSVPGVNVPGIAGGNVQMTPDGRGGMNLSVTNGENSVSIVGGRITVDNGKQHVSVAAPAGFALGGIAFGYGLAMLPIGIVGLLVCVWLTRVTWRALGRYVRRRIDAVSAKLERERAN
ncbi:Predicted membrane protein [Burkholderia pseudomallei]|nr:Predicted membrane protein [Burkholderia pseudomallei]